MLPIRPRLVCYYRTISTPDFMLGHASTRDFAPSRVLSRFSRGVRGINTQSEDSSENTPIPTSSNTKLNKKRELKIKDHAICGIDCPFTLTHQQAIESKSALLVVFVYYLRRY